MRGARGRRKWDGCISGLGGGIYYGGMLLAHSCAVEERKTNEGLSTGANVLDGRRDDEQDDGRQGARKRDTAPKGLTI